MPPISEPTEPFQSFTLPLEKNLFEALRNSAIFETLGKGRRGTVLVDPDHLGRIPIVRSTTQYQSPAQRFKLIHKQIKQQIQSITRINTTFNNALIEIYENSYRNMAAHSDQALDLAQDSFIALASFYQNPDESAAERTLAIESKLGNAHSFEIPLRHNSIVIFSTNTNQLYKHKIVLKKSPPQDSSNLWLGLTLRFSKTLLDPQHPLSPASEAQQKEFFKLRNQENREINFTWPPISYTISPSDLIPPL